MTWNPQKYDGMPGPLKFLDFLIYLTSQKPIFLRCEREHNCLYCFFELEKMVIGVLGLSNFSKIS